MGTMLNCIALGTEHPSRSTSNVWRSIPGERLAFGVEHPSVLASTIITCSVAVPGLSRQQMSPPRSSTVSCSKNVFSLVFTHQ